MDFTFGETENPVENSVENYSKDMLETEESLETLSSFGSEYSGEFSTTISTTYTEDEEEISSGETQNGCSQRICQAPLTLILIGLVCALTGVLSTRATELLNLSKIKMENTEMKKILGLNVTTTDYIMLLSAENTRLKLLLEETLLEKSQLQVEKDELKKFLNSTQKNYDLATEINRGLHSVLNQSLSIIAMATAESREWRLQFNNEKEISGKLKAENLLKRSVLLSNKLSFLWRYCSRNLLQCSHCMSGWIEHNSRCFFLPQDTKRWEDARRECLNEGGDLAVVLTAQDHIFLTYMTFQFAQKNLQQRIRSAWIGLQDRDEEGVYIWVNGNTTHRDDIHWRNNTMASGNQTRPGHNCVAIVPPSMSSMTGTTRDDSIKSWDDVVCSEKLHYLCETTALILS